MLTILVTHHSQIKHLTQQRNVQLECHLDEKRDLVTRILLLSTCLSRTGNTLNTKTSKESPYGVSLDTATPATLLINGENFRIFI